MITYVQAHVCMLVKEADVGEPAVTLPFWF